MACDVFEFRALCECVTADPVYRMRNDDACDVAASCERKAIDFLDFTASYFGRHNDIAGSRRCDGTVVLGASVSPAFLVSKTNRSIMDFVRPLYAVYGRRIVIVLVPLIVVDRSANGSCILSDMFLGWPRHVGHAPVFRRTRLVVVHRGC